MTGKNGNYRENPVFPFRGQKAVDSGKRYGLRSPWSVPNFPANCAEALFLIKQPMNGSLQQGRVVFGNLSIRNAIAKAEEIGHQQLGKLMRAIGVQRLEDTDQLIGLNLSIKLKVRPASGDYKASNDLADWKSLSGSAPAMSSAPAPSAASAAPPWAKK